MESTKKMLVPENDVRFVIQTYDKVDYNSKLFKWVCLTAQWYLYCTLSKEPDWLILSHFSRFIYPDGQPKECPIQPDGTHRTPKFRSGLDQQLQSAIPFVKRAEPVEIYNKDGIIASIMTGDCEVMDLVRFLGSYS